MEAGLHTPFGGSRRCQSNHTPGSSPQVSRDMWRTDVETKHCYACDETKRLSEFYRTGLVGMA